MDPRLGLKLACRSHTVSRSARAGSAAIGSRAVEAALARGIMRADLNTMVEVNAPLVYTLLTASPYVYSTGGWLDLLAL
eukprot:COSAG02_NODE_10809_length_1854_cov_1.212536_2_plen_79_part_00